MKLTPFRIQYNCTDARLNQLQFCHLDASISGNSHFDRVYGPGTEPQLQIKCAENRDRTVTVNEYTGVTTLLNIE